jgi:ectoine hydroxylase-related dioxygenase (phytanoyl-CoA dioxygenase family)
MEEERVAEYVEEIAKQGYTIVRDAIEPELVRDLVDRIREIAKETEAAPRGNPAEGYATLRTYNLLARGEVIQRMPVHENVLPIVEGVLDDGCLISGMTAIDIGPGEVPQPIHPDDLVMNIPKPHPPLQCTTLWALTDFTGPNGATRIIPNSHLKDHNPEFGTEYESIPAEMSAGSVLIIDGSLWHGGGANTTENEFRLGVNLQYCAGWVRQQQNQVLAIPLEVARTFSDRLLQLCGYSLFRGLMGHVDGKSPAAALGLDRMRQTAYQGDDYAKVRIDEPVSG